MQGDDVMGELKSLAKLDYELDREIEVICKVFNVHPMEVRDIEWINEGMTNDSFRFSVRDEYYVFRIAGCGTEKQISRSEEANVYEAIKPLNISEELLYFCPETGDKIAKYYHNSCQVAPNDWELLPQCMDILHELHNSGIVVGHEFNMSAKLIQFRELLDEINYRLPLSDEEIESIMETSLRIIENTNEEKVFCHMDAVYVNFLKLEDDETILLLDWEYSGMCHAVAEVAMGCVSASTGHEHFPKLLSWMLKREATDEELLLSYSYAATAGLLWHMWAVYREHHGADFADYSDRMWKTFIKYSELVNSIA